MKGLKQLAANIKPSKNCLLLVLTTIIFTLFTLFMLEVINRGSVTGFFDWSKESTFSFAITFLFLFLLLGSFFFLPNFLFIPVVILEFIFLLIVAFGSHVKFKLRGEYFTPFDLYLLNEGADISTLMNGLIGWREITAIIGILVILGLFCYFFFRFKKKVSFISRFLLSLVSVVCFAAIYTHPSLFTLRSYYKDVETVESYNQYGFIGAYLTLWEKAKKAAPEEYDKSTIKQIIANQEKEGKVDEVDSNFKPNIIVVLAEALWDPLQLKNITFKEDPIPYFRHLMETSSSGVMLTHTYGGGTFNTELEVLTGLSTRFSPEESYIGQMNRPIDSLAYVLKNQGYHTASVHNFKNWYYGRNEIYKLIGFDKFVSMEFFNNPNYIGPFIDDSLLMEKVLAELKQTKGPDFLNVVTVATHGPYTDQRYEQLPELTSSDMTDSSKYILNLYTKLLEEFDESMRTLIEGIKEMDEPTMVVVYGDHLPFLGEDYAVYRESGYYNGDLKNFEEYKKMYQTPLLVWNNFSGQNKREDLRMTPNFLGSYILAHANKEMSPIFQANRDLYLQGTTVIPRRDFFAEEGVKEADLLDFKLLQYDALKGNQYSYQGRGIRPNDDYILGSGIMKIDSIKAAKGKDGNYIININGHNFVSNAKVYIDGKAYDTKFIDSGHVSATISSNSLKKSTSHEIVIKLLDDKENVIVKTNKKMIPLD